MNDNIDTNNDFKIMPYRQTLDKITNSLLGLGLLSVIITPLLKIIINIINDMNFIVLKLPKNTGIVLATFGAVLIVISIIMFILFIKKPKFDAWIEDISKRKLSTKTIMYKRKTLFIDFDRNLNRRDLNDFVVEMSDKSEDFSYYFNSVDINSGILIVNFERKNSLPKMSILNIEKDTSWNIIPLGEAVNHELKTITPIAWMLNSETKRDDIINTMPSTSILISGGTGSGKSVLQQCIIGHISRFPDEFMLIGGDVKQVEFSRFVGVSSVKSISITIEEVCQSIEQAKDMMYKRFTFMKDNEENNIYNLIGVIVDSYIINNKEFQFDELFTVMIDDEKSIISIEEIYKTLSSGKSVSIDESYLNISGFEHENLLYRISLNDIKKSSCKYKPKAVVIMIDEMSEVMSGSNHRIVNQINTNIASIARLGRAAGVHLVLATQRPSGSIISADIKNNIQQLVLLGSFDSSSSVLVMDKDISHMSKPDIKGRGFVKSGNDIVEFQSYYTQIDKEIIMNDLSNIRITNKTISKSIEKEGNIENREDNIEFSKIENIERFIFEENNENSDIKNTNRINERINLKTVKDTEKRLNMLDKSKDISEINTKPKIRLNIKETENNNNKETQAKINLNKDRNIKINR